ncbi:MAG: carboxylating nicotinate-nucleotide diphosphorylase [Gammaproteobacteria bacterium]
MKNSLNPPAAIAEMVSAALHEDVADGDVTATLIDSTITCTAHVVCRDEAILCGTAWFDETFKQCDANSAVTWHSQDGDTMTPDKRICSITGNARAMVTAERTALNFLQTLSGTATATHRYVAETQGTNCRLLDTRKTIPLLRNAQKYAVSCGGGVNHRIGLYDGILIKENHIEAAGSVNNAIAQMRARRPEMKIEIEVENLRQVEIAIDAGADILLLDNFDIEDTRSAVDIAAGRVVLEASGGFELHDLAAVAHTGVDFISIGALTKHLHATDFSMRFESSFRIAK